MSHARDVSKFVKFITDDYKIAEEFIDSDTLAVSSNKSLKASTGTKGYNTPADLPANARAGSQAFVGSNNRLYISNGSGWYNIALINRTPYWITQPNGSYTLDTTGQATVITILGGDSDGADIPQYSATGDSNFNAIATVTKDSDNGRVFIVRAIDSEGTGNTVNGTGTLTFTLSDGKQSVLANSSFTITIGIEWSTTDIYSPAINSAVNTSFGTGARISDDGQWLLATTYSTAVDASADAYHRLWLFKNISGTWTLMRSIPGAQNNNNIIKSSGQHCDIDSNNRYIASGFPYFVYNSDSSCGKIDLYHDGPLTNWGYGTNGSIPSTIIYPPTPAANLYFGTSVTFDKEAKFLVTGAWGESNLRGQAYVYERTSTSGSYTFTWVLRSTITALDWATGDQFGYSTSISGNGKYIIVGSRLDDVGGTNTGSVYIYDQRGGAWGASTSTWSTKITANDPTDYASFGSSVSIDSDGVYAAVGARDAVVDGNNRGAVYIYKRSGSTTWTLQQKITEPTVPVASTQQGFGYSVGLSRDGTFLTVSTNIERDSENSEITQGGSVYVYQRSGETWEKTNRLISDTPSAKFFGVQEMPIKMSGDNKKIAIGHFRYPDSSTNYGRVVVHTRS